MCSSSIVINYLLLFLASIITIHTAAATDEENTFEHPRPDRSRFLFVQGAYPFENVKLSTTFT